MNLIRHPHNLVLKGSVALLLTMGVLGSVIASDVRARISHFCGDRVAHDYAQPFKRMKAVRYPPASGQLPFAPAHTYFESSPTVLVHGNLGGSEFGYDFRADPGGDPPFILHWIVTSKLIEVNARGKAKRVLKSAKLSLGVLDERELNAQSINFAVGPRPAFYRVDSVFTNADTGRVLARYSEYLRVVAPRYKARLSISSSSVRPGESLAFRIENIGTEMLSFSEEFAIEQYRDGLWSQYPLSLPAWHRILLTLDAGTIAKCQRLTVPPDLPAGQYRIVKRLAKKSHFLTAEFLVGS